jgi:hypothetical protein
LNQGESQDQCWCEVADESVVVSKTWPRKASNGVEEKTKLIISKASDGALIAKSNQALRRDEVHFKSVMSRCFFLMASKPNRYRGIPVWLTMETIN